MPECEHRKVVHQSQPDDNNVKVFHLPEDGVFYCNDCLAPLTVRETAVVEHNAEAARLLRRAFRNERVEDLLFTDNQWFQHDAALRGDA